MTSMTGFGRRSIDAPSGKLIVEIQSVNRKFLEVFVSLPKEFSRFEYEVRKKIGEGVTRGQVSVRVLLIPNGASWGGLIPETESLRALKKKWEEIAEALGLEKKSVDLPFLIDSLPEREAVQVAEDEDLRYVLRALEGAMKEWMAMKAKEGRALFSDMGARVKELERMLHAIETMAPDQSERMRTRLKERITEVMAMSQETEERIFREVALFAERVDIAEEIARLKSHFSQFGGFLKEGKEPVGRKMDFLVQEMGREINTIGSKSMDAKIAHLVVDFKSELEKIREQVQNIE